MLGLLLFIHLLVTPIFCALMLKSAFWSCIFTFVCVLAFWGANYIAAEIESPFGEDENDLPLSALQKDMNASLWVLLHPHTQRVPTFEFDKTRHRKWDIVCQNNFYRSEGDSRVSTGFQTKGSNKSTKRAHSTLWTRVQLGSRLSLNSDLHSLPREDDTVLPPRLGNLSNAPSTSASRVSLEGKESVFSTSSPFKASSVMESALKGSSTVESAFDRSCEPALFLDAIHPQGHTLRIARDVKSFASDDCCNSKPANREVAFRDNDDASSQHAPVSTSDLLHAVQDLVLLEESFECTTPPPVHRFPVSMGRLTPRTPRE